MCHRSLRRNRSRGTGRRRSTTTSAQASKPHRYQVVNAGPIPPPAEAKNRPTSVQSSSSASGTQRAMHAPRNPVCCAEEGHQAKHIRAAGGVWASWGVFRGRGGRLVSLRRRFTSRRYRLVTKSSFAYRASANFDSCHDEETSPRRCGHVPATCPELCSTRAEGCPDFPAHRRTGSGRAQSEGRGSRIQGAQGRPCDEGVGGRRPRHAARYSV